MKTIISIVLFITIAPFAWAVEREVRTVADRLLTLLGPNAPVIELTDRLLRLPGPGAPVVHENFVIFTAPSKHRVVGVAFAHENFFPVHWFRRLDVPQDRQNAPILPGQLESDLFMDSGIKFHVHQIPENISELEYRLVINGLWSVDPLNPITRRDSVSGLTWSVVTVPPLPLRPNPLRGLPQGLYFEFRGPPGEIVTVAGCFNGWDPFMFQLREGPAGVYRLIIPLPPGTYQYIFFHNGERFTDPYNPRRAYSRDGRAVSVITIQ